MKKYFEEVEAEQLTQEMINDYVLDEKPLPVWVVIVAYSCNIKNRIVYHASCRFGNSEGPAMNPGDYAVKKSHGRMFLYEKRVFEETYKLAKE